MVTAVNAVPDRYEVCRRYIQFLPAGAGTCRCLEDEMPISSEMKRLTAKWKAGNGWPKKLDSIDIRGIRGWTGQRFEFRFPIMALTGENGAGKSTVLQCAAAVYESSPDLQALAYGLPTRQYASSFFPETIWETVHDVEIAYAVREQNDRHNGTIRRPGERWRGNPERRSRDVRYIDLSRIQPVSARAGFNMLANPKLKETEAQHFDEPRLARLNQIMGRHYDSARMALTTASEKRRIPIMSAMGSTYSGFHAGAGETTVTEFLDRDIPKYSVVLIDEIESSLHPRAQRRLMRDLANKCREYDLQVLLTTHSPYILDELPLEARAYIMQSQTGTREFVYGVSSDLAMSKMDDIAHYECDVFVEDKRAEIMLIEIAAAHKKDLVRRFQVVPYGAASVGKALGQMVAGNRFPRPSCVFLDGDQGQAMGCHSLPGVDAPEEVVLGGLRAKEWQGIAQRTGRAHAAIVDACTRAMAIDDPHEWVNQAASTLVIGGDALWGSLCAQWAATCLSPEAATKVIQPIEDALNGITYAQSASPLVVPAPMPPPPAPLAKPRRASSPQSSSSAQTNLLSRLPGAEPESKP
jgi:predicted ATPase